MTLISAATAACTCVTFLCQDYTRDERLKSPHCARCLTDMRGQFFDGDCNRNALAYRQQCIDLHPDECPTLSAVIDCWGAAMDQQAPAAVFAPGRAPGAVPTEAERRAQHDQRPCSMPRRS
jgi:hypothetical protein